MSAKLNDKKFKKSLVWLRRDLRIEDQAALFQALQHSEKVWLLFVFDKQILDPLLEQHLFEDRRLSFIYETLESLDRSLKKHNSSLIVRYGLTTSIVPEMASLLEVDAVWSNQDYEPTAIARDQSVAKALNNQGRHFFSLKDQVIFHKQEILNKSGQPFSVFSPYKKAWLEKLKPADLASYQVKPYLNKLSEVPKKAQLPWPSLESMGFERQKLSIPVGNYAAENLLDQFLQHITRYQQERDYPAIDGSSKLSVHLRFGTISIRQLANIAYQKMDQGDQGAATWLSELIWREFYFMILSQHPKLTSGASFKEGYDAIEWVKGGNGQRLFQAWCNGVTGYPIVDAAMRQLNHTGWMHNRLRMVVASFLCKDLGVDWRWGEHYFAQQLLDFDFAANNGGWQWASSSGCDSQPYFRIFNPQLQSEKFDPKGDFIRKFVPELAKLPTKWIHCPNLAPANVLYESGIKLGISYPKPIVDHTQARQHTLKRYAVVKTGI